MTSTTTNNNSPVISVSNFQTATAVNTNNDNDVNTVTAINTNSITWVSRFRREEVSMADIFYPGTLTMVVASMFCRPMVRPGFLVYFFLNHVFFTGWMRMPNTALPSLDQPVMRSLEGSKRKKFSIIDPFWFWIYQKYNCVVAPSTFIWYFYWSQIQFFEK